MSPSITSYTSLSPCLYRSLWLAKDCQAYCAAQFPNGRGLSNKLNFPLRFNSVMGFDTNGAKSCKKEFFAPLLKIVNDNKNHKIYFYRSSTIYSRGGQAFLLDALPLLIFSKDPLRQCNAFRHLIYLLSRYSCYLWIPQHWVAVKACVVYVCFSG